MQKDTKSPKKVRKSMDNKTVTQKKRTTRTSRATQINREKKYRTIKVTRKMITDTIEIQTQFANRRKKK